MSKDDDQDDEYSVEVTMKISRKGKVMQTKNIDFGRLREAQVRGLTDLFAMLAQNVEYIKNLTPQFERLDKSKPSYLQ